MARGGLRSSQEIPGPTLVVAAHPDDIEAHCGGTVAQLVAQGTRVTCVLCTSGNRGTADLEVTMEAIGATREREQQAASDILGVMVDHLYGEVDAEQGWRLEAHVDTCAACRAEWEQLRGDVAALDRWAAPAPPPGLVEGVLADLGRRRAERAERGVSLLRVERAIGGILLGAVAAALSLLLVVGAAGVRVSPLGLGLLAALWATLYGAAFVLAQSSAFRGLGRIALVASGVVVASAPLLSIPAVVEACERLVKALQGGAPLALVIAVAAAGTRRRRC